MPIYRLLIAARFGHANLIARDYGGLEIEAATALPGARLRGAHLLPPGYGDGGQTLDD